MKKADFKLKRLIDIKEFLMTMFAWGAVFNLFLFVPLAFFGCMSLATVFVYSCFLFCLFIALVVVSIIKDNMLKDKMAVDFEEFKNKLSNFAKSLEKIDEDLDVNINVEINDNTDKEENKND